MNQQFFVCILEECTSFYYYLKVQVYSTRWSPVNKKTNIIDYYIEYNKNTNLTKTCVIHKKKKTKKK